MTSYEFTVTPSAQPHRVTQTIHTCGIAHLPGYLDRETTKAVADQSRTLLGHDAPWVTPLEYSIGKSVRLDSTGLAESGRFTALADVFASDHLRAIADTFMNGAEYVFNHDIYIAYDIEGSDHFAHGLHYDRIPHLKFFLYLTDVTTQAGPLLCVPRSHDFAPKAQAANRRNGAIPAEADTRMIPARYQNHSVRVVGPAGTLLAFTSDIIHSATHIEKGERLAVRNRCIEPRYLDAVRRQSAATATP